MSAPLSEQTFRRNTDVMGPSPYLHKLIRVDVRSGYPSLHTSIIPRSVCRQGRTCNAWHLAIAVIKERLVSDFHSFHEILCLMISLLLLKLSDIPLRPRAMFYVSAQAGGTSFLVSRRY
jgi:hypothetical protein